MISLCVFLLFTFLAGTSSSQESRTICKSVIVNCLCGTENNTTQVQLKLEPNVTTSVESGEEKCIDYSDLHQACTKISCFFINVTISVESGEEKCIDYSDLHQACAKISCSFTSIGSLEVNKEKNFLSYFYPQKVNILAGDIDAAQRFKREDEPCHVTALKNANIKCWKWPNWIKCDIKCIHGHAFQVEEKSFTSMSINCRKTENVWKPAGFIECLPYVNCNAQLVRPGDLKCTKPVNGPAYCEISCQAYEHYEAVRHQKYECVDEDFSKILPHCATLNEFVHLAEKPK